MTIKYDKESSRFIAGIAIVLMLIHHFFGFNDYLQDGSEWTPLFSCNGIAFERVLASFGKLCVSIFAFQSGYALWISRKTTTLAKIIKRGLRFLICYWVIEAFFLVCGVTTDVKLPDLKQFALNLIGLDTMALKPFVNVAFAWYVAFYLLFVILSIPLIKVFSISKSIIYDACLWIVIAVIFHFVPSTILSPFTLAITGIVAAKHDVFRFLNRLSSRFRAKHFVLFSILAIMLMIPLRSALIMVHASNALTDSIFVISFVYSCLYVFKTLRFGRLFRGGVFVGKISMNIWYLHGLFFTVLPFQHILYAPKYPVLILIWGLIMLIPMAFLFEILQKKILVLVRLQK